MDGGIFLTVKDLMLLTGSSNYNATAQAHKAVRDALATGNQEKKKLLIKEYCQYNQIDFQYTWEFLRGKQKFPSA